MEDTTYNGWTNYATWRINLEWFDGYDWYGTDYVSPDYLQEMVEEALEMDCNNATVLSYALAFLDDVNWDEIAEHINADLEVDEEEDE